MQYKVLTDLLTFPNVKIKKNQIVTLEEKLLFLKKKLILAV